MLLVWLPIIMGCSGESAPPVVPAGAPTDWFTVRLGSVVIGSESRRWAVDASGKTVWRTHRYPWSYDGEDVPAQRRTRLRLSSDGEVLGLWREGEQDPGWTGRALIPELSVWEGQLGPGPANLLDATTGQVEVTEITEDNRGELSWTLAGLQGSASPSGVVQWGPIAVHPSADGEPAIQPVDPVSLVRRRVDRLAVKRPAFVEFELDGVAKSVSSPIPLELPAAWRGENEALVARVRKALSHAPTPGHVSLSAALRDGLGDCNEMAALYVQYARERGWVARPVAGAAYVADPEPAMALHAWAEVWVNGTWVAVDPALNQSLADATHLKLSEEDELWRALVRLNGINSLGIVTIR